MIHYTSWSSHPMSKTPLMWRHFELDHLHLQWPKKVGSLHIWIKTLPCTPIRFFFKSFFLFKIWRQMKKNLNLLPKYIQIHWSFFKIARRSKLVRLKGPNTCPYSKSYNPFKSLVFSHPFSSLAHISNAFTNHLQIPIVSMTCQNWDLTFNHTLFISWDLKSWFITS